MYLLLQIKFYVTRGQYSDVYLNNQKFIRGVTVSGIWTVDAVWEGVTHISGGITSLCGELYIISPPWILIDSLCFVFAAQSASSEYLILLAHACFLPRIPTTTNSYLSVTYLSHAWCFSTTVWYWWYLLYIILFSICVGKSESLIYLQT